MATIADSNVLIDILHRDPSWADWSERQMMEAYREGPIVINPIIYAEVAAAYDDPEAVDAALPPRTYIREDLPWESAFAAGRAFRAYRREGGAKRSPLPDFYIGAHAVVRSYRLLTRDPRRYRAYFPKLDIISPETHP